VSDFLERSSELEELRARLAEAEETLRAIRSGEVDALVVEGPDGPRIYTLKGADEPYRLLVERMQEGAVTLNEDGVVLFCNESFATMLQVPLEQVIGASLAQFVAQDEQPALAAVLQDARSCSVRRELTLRRADGAPVPALLALGPLPIDAGVLAISMIASDLSEQKRTEELAAAERFLRSILEQATEPVLVLDAGGVVTHASRAALQLTLDDPLGRPFAQAVPLRVVDSHDRAGSRPKWLARQIGQALQGRSVSGLEVSAAGDGAERHHYLLSAGPLYDAREQVAGAVVMLTDITERKRFEQHQRVLLAELSHRVKNTLASVRSIAAQTLRSAPSMETFGPAFDGRLKALALAHGVSTGAGWGDADLAELIARILEPFRSGRGDNIAVAGPPAHLPPRQVVPVMLMLHELVTNAAKYGALSTAGGRVTIEWTVDHQHARPWLRLCWAEASGPRVLPPSRKGFGTALIERSVAHELDGSATLDYRPEGLVCTLKFPLDAGGGEVLREAEISAEQFRSGFESQIPS
jgi:PAS domain S-box-containing protein